MKRYKKSEGKKDSDGNRFRVLPIYKNVKRNQQDLYILSKETDRLDLLSQKYYSTPKFWWVIALANKLGKGSLFCKPGLQLRIPYDPTQFENEII